MELLSAITVGVLFSTGTALLLSQNVIRLVLGSALISYGVNLMLLTSGRLKRGLSPILREGATLYVDPVPQALILTAIVIGFAVTAFLFVLAYRTVQEHGTDDLEQMRGLEHE